MIMDGFFCRKQLRISLLIYLNACLLRAWADPEMDFEGGRFYCLFHVRRSFTLLLAIANVAVWGAMVPPASPLDPPQSESSWF